MESNDDVYTPGEPERVHPNDPIVHGRRWRDERDTLARAIRHVLRYGDVGKQSEIRLRAALKDAGLEEDSR